MTIADGGNDFEYSADEAGLLPLDESLDSDELGDEIDETGYSPLDWRPGNLSWGFTAREARTSEPFAARFAREIPDETAEIFGDDLGDAIDTDGDLTEHQVGSVRAGRLVWAAPDSIDPAAEYWANDLGIDAGGASAEEAAIHVIPEQDELD
jgi:hypothetical protein